MKNGIYFVTFSSNNNDVGQGTVVVQDNAINGGDFGFTYQGRVQGDKLDLHVSQHNPQAVNVIQGVNNYTMEMLIGETQNGYVLSGAVRGIPQAQLRVTAKFIGDLI
ncbi:GrlR family regulatory protein [Serratia rubidaea]|uniref:GrlR family regulatory protein n=1 Tax=Serratia rubidaea TaxID=61652 RepID=UPI00092FB7CD|nr:GrlR family regulatory protein [Serratia rubidaea]QPR62543.1 negative regulator GrlR [Serratia rubidaea]HAY0635941.1 negative regulator GrlR [Serratia rubidaea]